MNFGLSRQEEQVFKKLKNPESIQDFLDKLKINFEKEGDTLFSPRTVLKTKEAHCLEAALFAAAVLWYHGHTPQLLDLVSVDHDYDHVVALFKKPEGWGAISKTNSYPLRYRDPIYRDVREITMSYFHEYFMEDGKKTLKYYSQPFNLKKFGTGWITSNENLWGIAEALDSSPHYSIASNKILKNLRKVSRVELMAYNLEEWEDPSN